MLELSHVTLTDLNDTSIGRASRVAVVAVALVDGISTFLAALVVLTPFFAARLFSAITWAYYTFLDPALSTLFALGLFLGRVSSGNMVAYGIKTAIAGVISILISLLLGE